MTTVPWLRVDGDSVVITLHIQPGAKKTEVVGLHGEALKIRLAAPPVDGKANAALLKFLAAQVGAVTEGNPRGSGTALSLLSGDTSRAKRVRIAHVSAEQVRRALIADADA